MVAAIKYDPIRDLLCGIGKDALLTADQEVELSRQIQILRDIEKLQANQPDLTDQELANNLGLTMAEYRETVAIAQRAKRKMVQHNLRLVVSVAKKYQNRGLSFEDLIQEGVIGLNRGAEKFDHTKGYKFSTYAICWIKQGITRAIAEKSRTIRLPIHITEKLNKIKKEYRIFYAANGRTPTQEELSKLTGYSVQVLDDLARYLRHTASLDQKIGPNEDTDLINLISVDGENGIARVEKSAISERIHTLLDCLDDKQRLVVCMRWGLPHKSGASRVGERMTLGEIADVIEISRERVRQIQVRALRRLRSFAKRSDLQTLLED